MSGEPFKLKRRTEHGQTHWDVFDTEGVKVGTVFKYIGGWWANDAGTMGNRRGTKESAARLVWEMRHVPESSPCPQDPDAEDAEYDDESGPCDDDPDGLHHIGCGCEDSDVLT